MRVGALREHVISSILQRFSPSAEARRDALADVLLLGLPALDKEQAVKLAKEVPELPASLYEKWAGLFADRLFATVPEDQIRDLCRGTPEEDASLALVFVMFMESARMEKVVAEDLRSLPLPAEKDEDRVARLNLWLKGRASTATQ